VRRPHPPILIGGSGEGKTLRFVARYADACNLFDLPGTEFADNIEHKLRVLREHCLREHGEGGEARYAEIEKTITSQPDLGGPDPTRAELAAKADALLDHLQQLATLGIDHALISPRGGWSRAKLDAVTAILPAVHAIDPRP
jgi:alkanesulfonate monooxygenase SsuD/methylene tetrahydromethanopterin reductase-like flavin-dependent oxidoreductase (luciferase family)